MHIAWLGKKSPFCGNVTYGREVTNGLLERGYRISFVHFAQSSSRSERAVVPDTEESLLGTHTRFNGSMSGSAVHPQVPSESDCLEVSLPFVYKSQGYTIPSLKASRVLTRSLKELRPDLIHASLTLSTLDFRLPEICEELQIPLVATFHPPFDSKLRNFKSSTQLIAYQLYAPFLARYDRVVVFSRTQKNLLIRLGVPPAKLAVIPNGVNVQKYSPGPSKLKRQLNANHLFVYQGRIATAKNVEALLKAWKYARMGDDSKLLIVGDGPLAASLQSLYGQESGIVWLGFIADEETRIEILRAADVFILPSLVEGLSLSLLEAMACGAACVATDAGADGEVLEDGAGVVLDTQKVFAQLKTLLPLFCEHPEMVKALGQRGRARVLERYTLAQNITQLEKLYAEVLQQRYQLSR